MFATAFHQLRYAGGLLRGERLPVESLSRLARDIVATATEFDGPGASTMPLAGRDTFADPAAARALALRSLRMTARRAAGHTAYYRRLFEGRPPAAELTLETWTELPVTTKAALRRMPDAFVAVGAVPALVALTTGTTGRPTSVWFSGREIDMLVSLNTISAVVTQGIRPRHAVAYAGSSRATLALLCVSRSVQAAGAAFVAHGSIDPRIVLDRLAAPLPLPGRPRQATHLVANTSYLGALLNVADSGGWHAGDFGLETINVGGEVLSDALRDRAQRRFGARVSIGYALTEAVPAGAGRCSAGHLHHPNDFAYVEVLDPVTYRPTAPGDIGTIVVTPYVPYRECMLLLRYVTGDLVRTLAAAPTCEMAAVPATSDVLGRYGGAVSVRIPHREVLEILDAEPGVAQPARYVLAGDRPVLHVYTDRPSAALRSRLEDAAAGRGLAIDGIVLHGDITDLPPHAPPRADLREHTFEPVGALGGGAR